MKRARTRRWTYAAEETVEVPVTEAEAEALALAAATDVTDAMASDERVTPCIANSSERTPARMDHARAERRQDARYWRTRPSPG